MWTLVAILLIVWLIVLLFPCILAVLAWLALSVHSAPGLPDILRDGHWVLESAWRHSRTRAAFSAAQGMGLRRHLLQHDGRGCIARGVRRCCVAPSA
jgi:hypothetical protein